MKATSFLIFAVLALLASTVTAKVGNSRFHAAKCLALRKKCNAFLQRQSRVCRAGRFARNQSHACHKLACQWCRVPGKRNTFPCSVKHVRGICKTIAEGRRVKPFVSNRRPTPRATPRKPTFKPGSGSAPPKAGCVYSGSDRVVIDLGVTKMASGWERSTRNGMKGVIYKTNKGHGIDSASRSTTMCFKMKVSMGGDYLASAVSAAPHPTEYNDMWVSSSEGFKLFRKGKGLKSAKPNQMLKAYQNRGRNTITDGIFTIDHDPHIFVIPSLKANKVITYCMSGRSSKYEVFKLMIVKCKTRLCMSGIPSTSAFKTARASKCS